MGSAGLTGAESANHSAASVEGRSQVLRYAGLQHSRILSGLLKGRLGGPDQRHTAASKILQSNRQRHNYHGTLPAGTNGTHGCWPAAVLWAKGATLPAHLSRAARINIGSLQPAHKGAKPNQSLD